ncbi:patatin-like phospholipase family protein [Roseovarius sp. E0-M6]|uniref:patatin-like phospholipase family protein n=1 Tax=Roseovarius sp. E0-M6 TaxID=3127118 RepID=UPI0030103574
MAKVKRINLGLQGGGAHGAYTWGVLDRLLEDERIEIAAMSGTSAGAMNGAALKAGWVENGREGARARLAWLWERMGAVEDMRWPAWMGAGLPTSGLNRTMALSVPFAMADSVSRSVSPYFYGPFYRNPLRPIAEAFEFDKVCAPEGPALFVCATNVRSGKIRVFPEAEVSTDVLLASACLPTMFQAVEIGGEHYWDGGYTGNPAIFPLFREGLPQDVVVININPLERSEVPRAAHDIQNRINEISFNSSLLRELRAISFVQRLLDEGALSSGTMKRVLVHMIADDGLMRDLSVATKMVPVPELLWKLRDAGRVAADAFLAAHFDDLNERSTIDLAEMFS